MSSASYFSIGLPLLVFLAISVLLHVLARVLFLSSRVRSHRLFGRAPWLPLRFGSSCPDGEEVEFSTGGMLTLRGTYFSAPIGQRRGVVLFCHELNGNRYNVAPFLKPLLDSGFDLLAFDFRNHGQSDKTLYGLPTPWMTQSDLEDVKAAVDYLLARTNGGGKEISIFGLGKGATVALCVAGSDCRVKSVVLDAPIPENRLFEKNCWELLSKAVRSTRRDIRISVSLLFRAILFSLLRPVRSLYFAWQRFVLGKWFGCRFINPWPMAKRARQPMMIIHGHADSKTRAEQIRSFCDRLPNRPRLWIVPASSREGLGQINEECSLQVARFFAEQYG